MNIEKVKKFIQDLKELDTYNVGVDYEGDLYSERTVDGRWVNVYSIERLIEDFEKEISS